MTTPKVLAVVGPTASGKTSLAITLAQHCNGEVISADSRQVYRGLDIGTAKATKEEMQGVPHHLLDIVDIDAVYSAKDFVRDAAAAIADITSRGKVPIIAGGTFFYLDILRGKMQVAPVAPNPELRANLETKTTAELLQILETKSKARAANIDTNNRRRLIRSLEILDALGEIPPVTETASPYDMLMLGIDRPREELRDRYLTRAKWWLTGGLREETEQLLRSGVSRTRLQEIGFEYTLMLNLIDGNINEAEYLEQCVQKNWQYAKRQLTWLKRDPDITWYSQDQSADAIAAAEAFLQK